MELQKPLIVRTETIERNDIVVENASGEEETAEAVSGEGIKANTMGLFLVQTPELVRLGLSIFFVSLFGVAVLMFMLDKSWAPLLISRASISLLLILVLWIPEIL